VIFNHPMWDLYLVGHERHEFLVNEFLQKNGNYLHALELNGLRHWDEIAGCGGWRRSGTCCSSPAGTARGRAEREHQPDQRDELYGFVHEIRREKKSDMLFMPQYADLEASDSAVAIDAIREYPEFPQGSRTGTSACTIRMRTGTAAVEPTLA